MKLISRCLLVASLFLLTQCGNSAEVHTQFNPPSSPAPTPDPTPAPPPIFGSCHTSTGGNILCTNYAADVDSVVEDQVEASCNGVSGSTWSSSPCGDTTSAGAHTGTCAYTQTVLGAVVNVYAQYYGTGLAQSSARITCPTFGGTWTSF